MRWDQIARAWRRLVVKVASPGSFGPEVDSKRRDTIHAASSAGDLYEETRMTPYTPGDHTKRTDSSLHLSC
jgi:hypothetical protein